MYRKYANLAIFKFTVRGIKGRKFSLTKLSCLLKKIHVIFHLSTFHMNREIWLMFTFGFLFRQGREID